VGNAAWSAFFPDASVHNLAMIGSDHRPILLDTNTYTAAELILNRRRRRFEGKWLREEKVGEVVATAWEHAPPHTSVADKLAAVHAELHDWDRSILKAPQKKVKQLTKELDTLLSGPMNEDTERRQVEITKQIETALEKEEIYYMQRSQSNWLKHGDWNTSSFP
jgi:gamma-glutamylcyclotransferase (GGCT)/AIG2-like uncharacterized protein YtfP